MADVCKYCHEDTDGYVNAIDKNAHAYVCYNFISHNQELHIRLGGMSRDIPINYCPMCGRRLNDA